MKDNRKKVWIIASSVGLGIIAVMLILVATQADNNNSYTSHDNTAMHAGHETCLSDDCLAVDNLEYPAGELPSNVIAALNSAIDDEYKAHSTYEAVIDEIGSARPFSMIIRAEEHHIASLKSIYDKYGLTVPEDPYTNVEVADTKEANCAIGVQAEIDNAALYRDKLLPEVSDYPDISAVFTSLMNASQDKHLPAFERCAN